MKYDRASSRSAVCIRCKRIAIDAPCGGSPRIAVDAGGVSDGSRWSRAKRETTGSANVPRFSTAVAVADGMHAVWYLIRDPAGVVEKTRPHESGGRSLRSDHRLPSETPPASPFRGARSPQSIVEQANRSRSARANKT